MLHISRNVQISAQLLRQMLRSRGFLAQTALGRFSWLLALQHRYSGLQPASGFLDRGYRLSDGQPGEPMANSRRECRHCYSVQMPSSWRSSMSATRWNPAAMSGRSGHLVRAATSFREINFQLSRQCVLDRQPPFIEHFFGCRTDLLTSLRSFPAVR
jgi:hypothetical protein